jgi:hypothetical protein
VITIKAQFPEHLDQGFMMMKKGNIHLNDGTSLILTIDAFNMSENQLSGLDENNERHRVDTTEITEIELV